MLGLKVGDAIDVQVKRAQPLAPQPSSSSSSSTRDAEVLARVRSHRGTLPTNFNLDRLQTHLRGG